MTYPPNSPNPGGSTWPQQNGQPDPQAQTKQAPGPYGSGTPQWQDQDYPQPGQQYQQPGQGSAQPGQGYPATGQAYPQPEQGHPQPGQNYPSPGQGYPQQGPSPYGQPEQSPYGQPGQAPYGQPGQPPYGQPGQAPYGGQPSYGQPYGQAPQQGYSQGEWEAPPTAGTRAAAVGKTVGKRIVIYVVAAVVLGVGGLIFRQLTGAPSTAAVGDCMSGKDENDLKVVKCTDATATWTVAGKVDGKTESQFTADENICSSFLDEGYGYWEGKTGKTGYVLCLKPKK